MSGFGYNIKKLTRWILIMKRVEVSVDVEMKLTVILFYFPVTDKIRQP